MKVTLLGIGSGTMQTITVQAQEALCGSQAIIGAPRLLVALPSEWKMPRLSAVTAEDILARLEELDCAQAAVVFSGDSGFYSGARLLLPLLDKQGYAVDILPGLSSVQLLAARLGRPWQDWRLVSAHGSPCDAVAEVMRGQPVFFLTGGELDPAALCLRLTEAGLKDLPVTVGENLFCPDEEIVRGSAGELAGRSFTPLSVMLAQAAPPMPRRAPGWPDEWFIRGKAPMTKRMIRAAALSKLAVTPDDTCWDVGAGTGSVSVELAANSRRVYSVEYKPEALALIRENRAKFNAWNLTMVEGRAPNVMKNLPTPDAVFIGGSQGELSAIIDAALEKNPNLRLCITAIALETLHAAMDALAAHGIEAEVTQLSVGEGKTVDGLHLMTANNPIFLIAGNCP